ncbi:hypothetical protein D3C79_665170 [compost metagenome]
MLDLQTRQLIAAEPTPETDQQQGLVTTGAQQRRQVVPGAGLDSVMLNCRNGCLQMLYQQRRCLLRFARVERADALQQLAHHRRLGRVGKALADMPLPERCQALLEGADRVGLGVVGEVAGDAVCCRRQKASPAHFEVLNGGLITAPGVLPGGGLQIAFDGVHGGAPGQTYRPRHFRPTF